MKLTTMITIAAAMAVATSVSASAKETAKDKNGAGRPLTVYICDNNTIDPFIEEPAKALASDMFAKIGVNLHWRRGEPSQGQAGAIVVEFVTDVPNTFKPGALAYALPFEGVHIRIFANRINGHSSSRQVLAHVMVHEITHILQGEARHSAEGIMKARWTPDDLAAMGVKPLTFTAEDVDLIYQGMDYREAHAKADSKTPDTRNTTAAAVETTAK